MKVPRLIILLALVTMSAAQCDDTLPSGKECKSTDIFTEADPEACSYYFDCVNGCVTHKQCKPIADGLARVFDETYGWCSYRDTVDCGSRPCLDDEMCVTQPPKTTMTTTPDCGHLANCTALGNGYHPDPYNCRKYWNCIGNRGEHKICPHDPQTGKPEVFDLVYYGCNFQELTDCGERPICDECDNNCEAPPTTPSDCSDNPPLDCSSLPDGYYANTYNCRKYWHCAGGHAQPFLCPDDPSTGDAELFDLTYMGCNYEYLTDCGERPVCDICDKDCHDHNNNNEADCGPDDHHPPTICQNRPDGWYPDQFNCQKYWHCAGGHGTHYLCDDGLLYEMTKVQCDWPDRVNCGNRPICDHCDANCHPQN